MAAAPRSGHSGGMSEHPTSAQATEQSHTPPADEPGRPGAGSRPPGDPGWSDTSGADGFFARLRRIDLRRTPDGWIGGVCAGIAHRVGLDPLVIRAGAVLLGIFFGLGVLLYLLAWFFIPDGAQQTHAEQGLRRGKAASIFLLVLTAIVLLGSLPWWVGSFFGFDGGFGLVGLLVTALLAWGLWTVWQGRGTPGAVASGAATYAAPTSGYAAPPPPGAGAGGSYPGGAYGGPPPPPGGQPPAGPPPVPPAPPKPPKPRRLRRRSGGAALALIATGLLLVIVAGMIWAGPWLSLPGKDTTVALATAALVLGLLVLGLGLAGRRAGFVGFLTVVTVLAALVTAPLPAQLHWGGRAGDVTWAPQTVDGLRSDYRLGAGDALLDLRGLEVGDLDGQSVDVSLGAGVLTVVVPDDLTVQVDSEIGAGELLVRGRGFVRGEQDFGRFDNRADSTGGLGIKESTIIGESPDPHLLIRADVGLGQIDLVQQEPTP